MTDTDPRMRRSFTIPVDPSDEELARDWTLTPTDLAEVRRCRGVGNRHSFALQLCTVRRFGRFLGEDFSAVPVRIMNHIGLQLGLQPVLFLAPPAREATDLEHEDVNAAPKVRHPGALAGAGRKVRRRWQCPAPGSWWI